MTIRPKTLIRVLSLATALTAAPLAFSPQQGLVQNAACAQTEEEGATGTCCPERRSLCNNGGSVSHPDYYYKETGKCT